MSSWFREIRIIPILLTAAGGLLFLKTLGLILDGGYLLAPRSAGKDAAQVVSVAPAPQSQGSSQPSAMASSLAGGTRTIGNQGILGIDITGSVASKPAEKKQEEPAKKEEPAKRDQPEPQTAPESRAAQGTPVSLEPQRPPSPAERALLERLQQRRLEIETRARDLDMRESLLKAAEKNGENPGGASVSQGANGAGASGQASAARTDDSSNARLKNVVVMYETMKPRDAAKIFDRLDPKVLIEVASQIKPQRMAEILAMMSAETAERLTVEMATRTPADRTPNAANLPKIEGKPGG